MRNPVKAVLRRVDSSERLTRLASRVVVPNIARPAGLNLVLGEHYSLLVGEHFDTDADALAHYLNGGWRLGVVPNPYVEAPATRFSLTAALVLRNAIAAVAFDARVPFPFPSSRYAPGRAPVKDLTRRARTAPGDAEIIVGTTTMSWDTYVERCRAVGGAVAHAVSHGLIDVAFYDFQVGRASLGAWAALDDYLANGELDGRTVSPFFDSEWYTATERAIARRGRPVNFFLDFVATGERGPAAPQFFGQRYADTLVEEPPSLLGHFLHNAPADQLAPACDGVEPLDRRAAEAVVRARVVEYHEQQAMTRDGGRLAAHHVEVPVVAARRSGAAVVFVDERHLATAEAQQRFEDVTSQDIGGLRIVIVEQDDTARTPATEALLADDARVEGATRESVTETFAAVVERYLRNAQPEGWSVWSPDQRWDPRWLSTATAALAARPDLSAVAVSAGDLTQSWMRTHDALWKQGDGGRGVVFAGRGETAQVPDARLDLGIATSLEMRLASEHAPCGVVRVALVRAASVAGNQAIDLRAGSNAARTVMLDLFAEPPREGSAIVIPTFQDWRMTLVAVRSALATTPDDVEVRVIDNGSRRPVASILDGAFAGTGRVVVRRLPRNVDFGLGSNIGASDAARRITVFLNNDTAAQPGWFEPLVGALEDPSIVAAQPLLLYGDRSVQTAGTVFLGGMSMPQHLLANVHPLDVHPSIDGYRFSALTAACLAVRYDDLQTLGGFDPHYVNGMEDVDLSMRLRALGRLHVRTGSRVVHYESRTPNRHAHHVDNRARFARRWRQELVDEVDDRGVLTEGAVRIEDVRWRLHAGHPLWEPNIIYERIAPASVNEARPQLRWAIKTAATGDVAGDTWGDTFFADALARGLRAVGQEVVVDRSTSHDRPSSATWDDVTLTLRGLRRFIPQPGAINLLWVISHPDLVTRYELESGFQVVYAAGEEWAQRVRDQWGVPVRTLLQATDTRQFHPDVPRSSVDDILFVGRTRGVARPIVLDTIAAGSEPVVYGDDGWEQFIPARLVRAPILPNEQVPSAYASARVVLNDHWTDMADNGFFSNRLFDAAATGARVISDAVPGMAEVFGDQVQVYRSVDDLARLLDPSDSRWPDAAGLRAAAERIARTHSFEARAEVLLNDALAARKARR